MDFKNQESIHYRAGSKATHAGCEMLKGNKEIPRIIIERIEFVENANINGRTEKNMWLAHFQPNNGWTDLPMCLNQTNCRRITKLYPSCQGYIARLKNIAVRLTSELCKDPNGGGTTYGLRISKIEPASEQEMAKWMADNGYAPQPQQKAKKEMTEDKIPAVVTWMQEKGKTLEDVENLYNMSEDVKAKLVQALNPVGDMPAGE